jgi:hypothetical protein
VPPACVQVQQRVLQYVQQQWRALKPVNAVKTALSATPFVDTGADHFSMSPNCSQFQDGPGLSFDTLKPGNHSLKHSTLHCFLSSCKRNMVGSHAGTQDTVAVVCNAHKGPMLLCGCRRRRITCTARRAVRPKLPVAAPGVCWAAQLPSRLLRNNCLAWGMSRLATCWTITASQRSTCCVCAAST